MKNNICGLMFGLILFLFLQGFIGFGFQSQVLAQSSYDGLQSYGNVGLKGRAVSWRNGKVSTQIPGMVLSFSVKVGDKIKKGDIIAIIDSALLQSDLAQARSELEEAKAKTAVAKAQMALKQNIFARQKKLKKSAAFQKSRYDEARLAFTIAQAEFRALQAREQIQETILQRKQLDITLSKIYAPYDGVIQKVFTQKGAFITSETPNLVEMIDTKSIEIEVDISAQDTAKYKEGQTVSFQNGDQKFQAKVRALLPTINIRTQTRAVRFTPLDPTVIKNLVTGQEVSLLN